MLGISFAQPWFFLLFLLLLPMFFFYKNSQVAIAYSSLDHFPQKISLMSYFFAHLSFFIRMLVLSLFILALARPQLGRKEGERKTQGLDMILAIDTSESMMALDLKVRGRRMDRLSVIKSVVGEFIEKRTDDRLGLVVFGAQAYSQTPLTLDHDVLKTYLDGLSIGMAGRSTAIGDALGVAINSIKDVKSKSKIIILLTDGENTAGKLDPLQMLEVAKSLGIKIYTIGVGSQGRVPIPTAFGVRKFPMKIDEKLLKKIAGDTGALYFRAENTEALVKIYESIDKLEKSELKVKSYRRYDEKYVSLLWVAFFLFVFEILLSASRFRRIP